MPNTNKERALGLIAHARKMLAQREPLDDVQLMTLRGTLEGAETYVTDIVELKRQRRRPAKPAVEAS